MTTRCRPARCAPRHFPLTRTDNSQAGGTGPLGRGRRLGIARGPEGDANDLLSSVVNAAILVYPIPLEVGQEWKSDSVYADDDQSERYDASSKVDRTDRVTVGRPSAA